MAPSRDALRLGLLRALATVGAPFDARQPLALPAAPRILLIRPDHIGDLLLTTPALRVLRQAYPKAHIACMIGPWGQAVLEDNPHLDERIVCEFPGFARTPKTSAIKPYRVLWEWARRLRAQRFDLAIVLRFDHWWGALLAYLAGIPRRLGYDMAEVRPFLSEAIPYIEQRHEVLQSLTLVRHAIPASERDVAKDEPQLEFLVSQRAQEDASRYLARRGVAADRPLVVIHPGAGAAVKLWLPKAFAQVADALIESHQATVLITGSRNELPLAWSVYAHMYHHAPVSAGDTTLGQLAAMFQRAQLVIGPDCGPLHLAVAAGAPTIHLYGPVDVTKFGPWGGPDRHVALTSGRECIPCNRLDYPPEELPNHPCVREIPVSTVLVTARRLLQAS